MTPAGGTLLAVPCDALERISSSDAGRGGPRRARGSDIAPLGGRRSCSSAARTAQHQHQLFTTGLPSAPNGRRVTGVVQRIQDRPLVVLVQLGDRFGIDVELPCTSRRAARAGGRARAGSCRRGRPAHRVRHRDARSHGRRPHHPGGKVGSALSPGRPACVMGSATQWSSRRLSRSLISSKVRPSHLAEGDLLQLGHPDRGHSVRVRDHAGGLGRLRRRSSYRPQPAARRPGRSRRRSACRMPRGVQLRCRCAPGSATHVPDGLAGRTNRILRCK